jgi:hypothetical protein
MVINYGTFQYKRKTCEKIFVQKGSVSHGLVWMPGFCFCLGLHGYKKFLKLHYLSGKPARN